MTALQQDIIKEARKATDIRTKAQALTILAKVTFEEMKKKARDN